MLSNSDFSGLRISEVDFWSKKLGGPWIELVNTGSTPASAAGVALVLSGYRSNTNGVATVKVSGKNCAVGVYTGSPVDALAAVTPLKQKASQIQFEAAADTYYRIAVAGTEDSLFTLMVKLPKTK